MSNLPSESDIQAGSLSPNAQKRSPLWWPLRGWVTAVLAVLALSVSLATWVGSDARRGSGQLNGLIASISIEPFATGDSMLPSWNSKAFAESLAAQLATIRGLEARVHGSETATDFRLRGEVSRSGGRLVITTRLGLGADTASTVWTATYWRGDHPGTALADDIAAGVAEAMGSNLLRLDPKFKR